MKMKFYTLSVMVLLVILLNPASVLAQNNPVQLALFTPVQIVPEDQPVNGFRFNLIYGRNLSVTGFDLGLINHSTGGLSQGVQFGFVGLVEEDFTGWQNNSFNITRGRFEGLQWGFYNYANQMNGIQFGFINYAVNMKGIQVGLINIIKQNGAFPVFPIVNWSF